MLSTLSQKFSILHLCHHEFLLPGYKGVDPLCLGFEEVSLLLGSAFTLRKFGDFLLKG